MSRLRLLFVLGYFEPAYLYGGPIRTRSVLSRALVRAGADVTVFATDAHGKGRLDVPIGQPVHLDGVQVYYFRRNWGQRFFYSRALGRACRQHIPEFDLVHSSGLWVYSLWPVSAACRRANVPWVESPMGQLMPWCLQHRYWKKRPYFNLVSRPRLNQAAAIHCTDDIEKEHVQALGLKPPVFVVPSPIDPKEFEGPPARGEMRARLGLPADASVSLFLGRLASVKGVDLAVEAFAEVAREHPRAYFVIAGPEEDGSGARARQRVAQLRLDGRVRFLGPVAGYDRLAALADADLFVMPSRSENFGVAAAEAMAAGLPVLLSDQVGIARHAASAGAARMVPLEVPRIASAWGKLLADPQGMEALAGRARAFALEEYDADAVARRMLDAYQHVIENWKQGKQDVHSRN